MKTSYKIFFNVYSLTVFVGGMACILLYFDYAHLDKLLGLLGADFFKTDIKNIAIANIGLFASITGFFIAATPFLIGIIGTKRYLLDAVKNNLNEITSALKVLVLIGIVSIAILFSNPAGYSDLTKIISVMALLYLYILFFYYIYEIIKIMGIFVADLKSIGNCCEESKNLLKELIRQVKNKNDLELK